MRPHINLAAVMTMVVLVAAAAGLMASQVASREDRIPAGKTLLYSREAGRGQPIIVLHGGRDFDTRYLLPDMDRLADRFRLIYYDQGTRTVCRRRSAGRCHVRFRPRRSRQGA